MAQTPGQRDNSWGIHRVIAAPVRVVPTAAKSTLPGDLGG